MEDHTYAFEDSQLEVVEVVDDVIERIIARSTERGLSELEVYVVKTNIRVFTVANDKIIEASSSVDHDIGLRGSIGKRVGAIRLNNLPRNPDEALDSLIPVVKSSPEDPYWSGFASDAKAPLKVEAYDPRIGKMTEEEYVELLKATMERLKEPGLRRGVEKAFVAEGLLMASDLEVTISNTHGVCRSMKKSIVTIWLTLNILKNGSQSDYGLVYNKGILDQGELERKALESGERALLFFNSKPIESGEYEVVFEPTQTGLILQFSLAPAFSGLNILENRSPLRSKLGEVVFSDKVSIRDNPELRGGVGTRGFDDEGVATSNKRVVDKGVFKTILHSHYTAKRMNTDSTGNGIRTHPAAQPQPGFTNLELEPGSGNLEEFTRDLKKGIVVYDIIGYWMSDPFTGSVKATVTHGLLVENGVVVKPVKGVVIGGSIYDWLSRNLVSVGGDSVVNGNASTPSILISSVKVAGK
jgi:PmbA protein